MRIWRISNHLDLSGRGGVLAAGRWNRAGTPVVYCADHPATALLEVLVHLDREDIPARYKLLAIDVPDDAPTMTLTPADLIPGWRTELDYTRRLGAELLKSAEHLTIVVPCVLAPMAQNILLNPRSDAAAGCSIVDVIECAFDPRLVR